MHMKKGERNHGQEQLKIMCWIHFSEALSVVIRLMKTLTPTEIAPKPHP
jgi:hypothetical protein